MTGTSESNATGNKTENILGQVDFWAVRIDAIGNKIWDRTIGANGLESNKDTIQSIDGGHVLLGRASGAGANGHRIQAGREIRIISGQLKLMKMEKGYGIKSMAVREATAENLS